MEQVQRFPIVTHIRSKFSGLSACSYANKQVGSKRYKINILCNLKCFNILLGNSETPQFESIGVTVSHKQEDRSRKVHLNKKLKYCQNMTKNSKTEKTISPKHWGSSQPERSAGTVACVYLCWKIYPLEDKSEQRNKYFMAPSLFYCWTCSHAGRSPPCQQPSYHVIGGRNSQRWI